ncbi:MAG: hypothetical protein JJE04_03360, partial [Acidobacteriia bacterium]|nr:hypothetical protein [Terriglobia bacterium]
RAGQYPATANAFKQEPIAFNDMIVSVIDNTRSTPGASSLSRQRDAGSQTIDPITISIPFGDSAQVTARVALPFGNSVAGVTTLDGAEWLSVSSLGEIAVDPGELAIGVHTGVAVLSGDGETVITVPVTVNITAR